METDALKKAVWDMALILSCYYATDLKARTVMDWHADTITKIRFEKAAEQALSHPATRIEKSAQKGGE